MKIIVFTDKDGVDRLEKLPTDVNPIESQRWLDSTSVFLYREPHNIHPHKVTITIEKNVHSKPFLYRLRIKLQRIWKIIRE